MDAVRLHGGIPMLDDGDDRGCRSRTIAGCHIHGLFHSAELRHSTCWDMVLHPQPPVIPWIAGQTTLAQRFRCECSSCLTLYLARLLLPLIHLVDYR